MIGFTSNDQIVLKKKGKIIDKIGKQVDIFSSRDKIFRRKTIITKPNLNYDSLEWDIFLKHDISRLGYF
ncbi:MAG: hypothetical protein ABI045_03575 [Flavobacteriales bacterium]